jgi:hypothetical protein
VYDPCHKYTPVNGDISTDPLSPDPSKWFTSNIPEGRIRQITSVSVVPGIRWWAPWLGNLKTLRGDSTFNARYIVLAETAWRLNTVIMIAAYSWDFSMTRCRQEVKPHKSFFRKGLSCPHKDMPPEA